ncbi:MAG: orotidine-5'-phosphate decarboxylase [Thermodesulfobacteriota bacterium]
MEVSSKDRIIFALDFPELTPAVEMVTLLKDSVGVIKVGLQLFIKEGPKAVEEVKKAAPDCKVFLDMKLHDIPATVGGAYKSAVSIGVDFVTAHVNDINGIALAVKDAHADTKVLGVTLLTSVSSDDLKIMGFSEEYQDPHKLVLHRALMAKEAGLAGVVCSPLEAAAVREAVGPDFIIVTPGIRPTQGTSDDQKRIATPHNAIKDGADYIVVGRPIKDAADPVESAEGIARDIERAQAEKAVE